MHFTVRDRVGSYRGRFKPDKREGKLLTSNGVLADAACGYYDLIGWLSVRDIQFEASRPRAMSQ